VVLSCLASLSLQPFDDALATPEGVVFDSLHIVPYVSKHGVSPVTGKVSEFPL
jgi:peptidyl-prolyl cis-trans isomerase-like protein 2